MTEAQPKTVTVEEFEAQKAELEKLKKIFDERQTKVNAEADKKVKEAELTKEQILKALGIEKDPQKPEADLINERIGGLNKSLEQLQADLKAKEELLTLKEKQAKAQAIASQFNLYNVTDIMPFIDINAEDLQAEIKKEVEKRPYLVKAKVENVGNAFNNAKKVDGEVDPILSAFKKGLGI